MNKIVAIYGPTTSNKMGLALKLSEYLWGKHKIEPEVINVDSRKIYRDFIISQSLPTKKFSAKAKTHLFGTVSAKKELDLFEFQALVKSKIKEVQERDNLPILVGGSSLHLAAVVKNWKKGSQQKIGLPPNTLVFNLIVNRPRLKKAIKQNVSRMFKLGLYQEFRELYGKAEKGSVSEKLLRETLGYRQFLEMAKAVRKNPHRLNKTDLFKTRKRMVKDILNYAYHQILDRKKFPGMVSVRDYHKAKEKLDFFLEQAPFLTPGFEQTK